MWIAGRSPESSTHLRRSLEMVATTLMFSPVPARAPVCVTESLPLISQGLVFCPFLLLPSQPTMCTLLTKFKLNKMGKKDILKGHLMAFSFVRCDKGCNGLYYKMVQKANGSLQCSLPKCNEIFLCLWLVLTLESKNCREQVFVVWITWPSGREYQQM